MKFEHVAFEMRERTDRQTDRQTYRHTNHNALHACHVRCNISNFEAASLDSPSAASAFVSCVFLTPTHEPVRPSNLASSPIYMCTANAHLPYVRNYVDISRVLILKYLRYIAIFITYPPNGPVLFCSLVSVVVVVVCRL